MTEGAGKRFQTVLLLPLARRPVLRRLLPRLGRYALARRLARLFQFLISRREYLTNVQQVEGCSRLTALRRTLPPYMRLARVWDGLAETYYQGAPPSWLAQLQVLGLERVVALYDAGTPIILIAPHLSLSGLMLTQVLAQRGIRFVTTALTPDILTEFASVPSVDADTPMHGLLALRQGKVLIHAGDVPAPGLPCSFFGQYVSFPTLVARLAARTGAALVTAYCHETAPGRWQAVIDEPVFVKDQSPEEAMRHVVGRVETIIRAHPYEWALPKFHPFMRYLSFPRTGELPILVGFASPEHADVRESYVRHGRAYAGIDMMADDLAGLDLAAVLARLERERREVLLLVHPALGANLADLPQALLWFFRLDADFTGYDPPDEAARQQDIDRSLTTFAVSLVKTVVIRRLVAEGARGLDAHALRRAKRLGFGCYAIPSAEQLAAMLARAQPDRH